ncbi:restriction endonuclease subunit S, partial [Campylobacter vicugnae]|uniref:restriction endonuclease subunit S n=1 Tax=Campylobacter vicugnae TaxID=1660076 RepID=UPI00254EED25
MANTPKIRFKNFSDEWVESRLGELGNILTGSTPPTNISELYDNNGIPWVTPTDITSNLISKTCKRLSKKGELVSRIVPSKTILVTCIASIGKNAMLLTRGSFNQQINSLTVNDNNDPYFMLTQSSLWSEQMKKQAAQATMQIVNKTEFSNIKAYIPNLTEQEKIGAFFSKLDKLISLHQSKFEKLQKIKKSCLQNLFPQNNQNTPKIRFKNFSDEWVESRLGELGNILTGSTPPTNISELYDNNGIPWVTPTDITSNLISKTCKRLSKKGELVSRIVPSKTILVTCIASIGKNAMLLTRGSFNQQINSLTVNDNNDPYFMLTQSSLWSEQMKKQAAQATMQIVNKTEFSNIKAYIPNLTEQEKIGAFFSKLDKLISLHQSKFEKLQKIKKSCLQN